MEEDIIRGCRFLLNETSTTLRLGKGFTKWFETNNGSPQADAISGVMFDMVFEKALRDQRSELNKNNLNIEHSYSRLSFLTIEMIYADGTDFPT